MTLPGSLKWIAGVALAPLLLAALFLTFFGWNWLRGPLQTMTNERTGRVLAINGDLKLDFGWPLPRIRADLVTFANPAWAREKYMVTAAAVEIAVDLRQLLRQRIVLPEVRLEQPVVFLEQGRDGRKNWLLDLNQRDEGARIRIDRLTLDHGTLGYDNAQQQTSIRAELSTADTQPAATGVSFSAQGHYQGLPLTAHGIGGPVLGLRDESTPYPLHAEFTVGRTGVKVDGSITSLLKFSAIDMQLALHGDSLAQLFPLLGIAFPETRAYAIKGHLLHREHAWRYEKFTGRIGGSDIAGIFQIDSGTKPPSITANLDSKVLDIADLGPLIGARPGKLRAAKQAPPPSQTTAPTPTPARVLPDVPFRTDRWHSVNAEVTLRAATLRHARELPIENLVAHLSLRDSVLTLDPLDFGVAGGHLKVLIALDGRKNPIQAHALVRARTIQLAQLLPTVELSKSSAGQLNGDFDLAGKGNSVRSMLASADGKVALIVSDGKISKLMMEMAGLHLWEILELKLTGDQLVKLRCAVADFDVKHGTMHADALVFDTEVTTIVATGDIDLGQEKLDLTLNQKTKNTSPLALRSPIYLRGSFAKPAVEVDKGRVAARALGALALGIVNPVLALLPLIDPGPGKDSDCRQLVSDAKALPRSAANSAAKKTGATRAPE